ncbi:hypothetical protein [Rugosimonospora africana]|uniref:Uncharacterized protein n=1 Tax=Rugosimonospora africana TaxID=556532 RepID=A0A8J3QZB8_9ACTN|nr:hypothetical protein [Rugosimonospora africana]GIH18653.1 hypothetical protein Raf01_68250 [Rugosimonospora africana]
MKYQRLRVAAVAATALAVLGSVLVASAPATAASNAPGGMHRFVVAIGEVNASVRTNWERLGMYTFDDTNGVTETHWHWTQRDRVSRSSTGNAASNCGARNCVVMTGNGYQSTTAPNTLHGTYTVTGSVLRVTWDGTTGWEEWTISEPIDGKLAKLTYRANSFGATNGFGYGSDRAWNAPVSTAQIAAANWTGMIFTYYTWATDSNFNPYIDHGDGSRFWNLNWTPCTGGRCLGGTTTDNQYYISRANKTSTDLRDTLWYWRTANADNRGEYCYTGNSHVKPMLEVIDNDGVLHGWVGVEASLNQTVPSQGTSGDDIGVFQIADV